MHRFIIAQVHDVIAITSGRRFSQNNCYSDTMKYEIVNQKDFDSYSMKNSINNSRSTEIVKLCYFVTTIKKIVFAKSCSNC